MSADHKRPLFAFVFVLLVCSLIMANGLRSEAFVSVLRTGAAHVVAGVEMVTDTAVARGPRPHEVAAHEPPATASPVRPAQQAHVAAVAHTVHAHAAPTAPVHAAPGQVQIAPGHAQGPAHQAHTSQGHANQGHANQAHTNHGHQKSGHAKQAHQGPVSAGHAQAGHAHARAPHGVAAGWLAHGLGHAGWQIHRGHGKGHAKAHGKHVGLLARALR